MANQIFVNLPVKDLDTSKAFFEAIGYTINPQFTNEQAASVVISDTIYAMLLTEPFYQTFTSKQIADARTTSEALLALGVESREAVDTLVDKALAVGATEPREAQDHGFMYSRAFDDLDGHGWEVVWMDPATVE
ncbi:VOC family protein [Herbiconiux daphne]|uniref:VOC family protein n=1 Tax=Herbiconiux daphne TaxID=2970914 RepID=A0ABT2GWQ5_9MICO|nr:VOC family protein [Herbiconiux daphne]MCS5732399.1 VOC family protein [Herbiconiux daphne]